MQKQKYKSYDTALLVVDILDKYKEEQISHEKAESKIKWVFRFRKNNIYSNKDTEQYTTLFVKTLGKKRMKLLKQLMKERGEIYERQRNHSGDTAGITDKLDRGL